MMNFDNMICLFGKWYEVGDVEFIQRGETYLESGGRSAWVPLSSRSDIERHRLTPIPDTDERVRKIKLGEAAFNSVPEELRPRVTGELRPPGAAEYWMNAYGNSGPCVGSSAIARIILSPPPEPKKTPIEMLAMLVKTMQNAEGGTANTLMVDTLRDSEKYLDQYEPDCG